jgi:hypothetical protein
MGCRAPAADLQSFERPCSQAQRVRRLPETLALQDNGRWPQRDISRPRDERSRPCFLSPRRVSAESTGAGRSVFPTPNRSGRAHAA